MITISSPRTTWIRPLPGIRQRPMGSLHVKSIGVAEVAALRFPITSLAQILERARPGEETLEAPPGCWITGSWAIPEDTIVDGVSWAHLAWTDGQGRLLSSPKPAFFQHVFGPGIPAYTIRTPGRTGSYHLTVFDRRRHPRATISYRIVPNLAASQSTFPPRRQAMPSIRLRTMLWPGG